MNDPLARFVAALPLLEASSGFRLVVIGGVARGVWASPRATMDLDVLVDCDDASAIVAHASAAGLLAVPEEVARLKASGMTRLRLPEAILGAVRLDVIAADHAYYRRVIERSRRVELWGQSVRVAAPEDILLLKLLADRTQDRADIEAILRAQAGFLDIDLLEREAAAIEVALPAELQRSP